MARTPRERPRPAFLFSADWHLCRTAWKGRAEVVGDADHALARVVDLAIRLNVPLLAGGDLFDSSSPHPDDVAFAGRQMARMQAANLAVYFVQGNHDRVVDLTAGASPPTPWLSAASPWPLHVDGKYFSVGPYLFRGMDYLPAGKLQQAMASLPTPPPRTHYLLCHQEWAELTKSAGNAQGSLLDLPDDIAVLTGDLHRTTILGLDREMGVSAYSPGALHRLAMDEPDSHAVFLFYEDSEYTALPISSRYIARSRANDEVELARLLRDDLTFLLEDAGRHARRHRLPPTMAKPFWRVQYDESIENARERLTAAARDHAHLFLSPIVRASADLTISRLFPETSEGLMGGLIDYDLNEIARVNDVEEPTVRADLARLLSSTFPATKEIAAMMTEALKDPGRPA